MSDELLLLSFRDKQPRLTGDRLNDIIVCVGQKPARLSFSCHEHSHTGDTFSICAVKMPLLTSLRAEADSQQCSAPQSETRLAISDASFTLLGVLMLTRLG